MLTLRPNPFIYTSWLAKALAGDAACLWSMWFRAHYRHDRLPSDFTLTRWTADHCALVRAVADTLQAQGYTVTLEQQNGFALRGGQTNVTLAGMPDVIAINEHRTLIVDCKTGAFRQADQLQVATYMLVLPTIREGYHQRHLEGLAWYGDNTAISIPASMVDDGFRARVHDMITVIGGPEPPARVPSFWECRRCDIGPAGCADRYEGDEVEQLVTIDACLF